MFDINCPYCYKSFKIEKYSEQPPGHRLEAECPKCKKNMIVYYELSPIFFSKQAPCLNGGKHCFEKK